MITVIFKILTIAFSALNINIKINHSHNVSVLYKKKGVEIYQIASVESEPKT